jgi:hypothetical protein
MKDWQSRIVTRQIEGKGTCVFATDDFVAGEMMGYYEGYETTSDTMHSIHLDGIKVEGTGILSKAAHSCDPNSIFKDKQRWLYALKDIKTGEEVTIDYLYTEPVISHPFMCSCGSSNCRGKID